MGFAFMNYEKIIKHALIEKIAGIERYHKDGGIIVNCDDDCIYATVTFIDGLVSTIIRTYFIIDNTLFQIIPCKHAEPHGKYTSYWSDGIIMSVSEFENGKEIKIIKGIDL